MEQRQSAQEPIIIPPSEAAQYLAQRDIEVDLLKNGLQVGFTQRRNCSEFHPVTAPGYYQWAETNAEIRRNFCASGRWALDNPDNRLGECDEQCHHPLGTVRLGAGLGKRS